MHPFAIFLNLLFLALPGAAPIDELAAAERDFAADGITLGVNPAFLKHFAADGWIFRPYPVAAREWLRKQPKTSVRLLWGPQYLEVSAAGDLGMSMGPWHISAAHNGKPVDAYGHFMTVWQRNKQGCWEVLADHGASHAEVAMKVDLRPRNSHTELLADLSVDSHTQRLRALEKTDDALRFALQQADAVSAYKRFSTDDVLLLRDGAIPAPGAIPDVLKQAKAGLGAAPRRAVGISRSGDLGYTLGGSDTPENAGRGVYERLWRYNGKIWQLSADVTDSAE